MTDFKQMAKELCKAGAGRTDGPWYERPQKFDDDNYEREYICAEPEEDTELPVAFPIGGTRAKANSKFIAHCGTHADAIATALEKASELASERDDALARVKTLEEEIGRLKQDLLPDMFWDADGNENCHGCPEEIAELAWDNAHPNDRQYGIIEVQQAARLNDQYYLWKRIDRPDCSLKDFELTKITSDQANGVWAAQIIEDFTRAIARQALQENE